jgi:chemotaxis protein MotB
MKNSLKILALFSLLAILSLSSCGPSKALLSSRAESDKLRNEKAETQNLLNDCNTQVTNLKQDKVALQLENAKFQDDLSALSTTSNLTIADQAKRLKNLQSLIQAQKDVMAKLKSSISDALVNYKSDELSVYIKDGNVYVSLEEKLLFKSGSDKVDPKGKEALKTLAQVLNNTKDITVVIEGHTDNVPIKTNRFEDNWDLSSARATSIVRILTKDNGFDPGRITASGRGKFHPVKSNETAEGRAGNRRTEIILSPNLNEIYKLLEQ